MCNVCVSRHNDGLYEIIFMCVIYIVSIMFLDSSCIQVDDDDDDDDDGDDDRGIAQRMDDGGAMHVETSAHVAVVDTKGCNVLNG